MRHLLTLIVVFYFSFITNILAAPPAPESFGSLPKIYDAAISPAGKKVAMIRVIEGQYYVQVIVLAGGDKKSRLLALAKGVKPISVVWANSDRLLVSIWQSEKLKGLPYTAGYMYTVDANTMKGKVLVRPKTGVFRQYNHVVVDYLKDDPEHILMAFSLEDNNETPDIRKVNVNTGKSVIVKRGLTGVQSWYTDLRGEPRVGQGLRDRNVEQRVLRIRDANSDKWRDANDFPGLAANTQIRGFTADPNELIIADYQGKDTTGLYIYNLQEKKITRQLFHNNDYDAGNVILSQNGEHVIGATFVAEATEVELFGDYSTALSKLKVQYPSHSVDYIDQSIEAGLIIVKMSNSYDPGMFLLYDVKQKKINMLGKLYPDLDVNQLGEVVSLKYSARDKTAIPAFITLPPVIRDSSQLKSLPFVVLPHGGPYGRDEKRFDYLAQFFATRGFGVLQMNFRGSDGYGKTFEESGRKNWVVMQEDVEDGARWLIEQGYADPERLCIVGWSYGGYAALMGALKNPELYACAISMAGVTDLQDMIKDIKQYRFGNVAAQNFVLNGFENKDDIKANSPVKLAADLTVPLLLAHGTGDQRVHIDQFRRMKKALNKVKTPVTYLEFRGEDHFLSNEKNRVKFFQELDKFLEKSVGKSKFTH